MRRRIVSIAYSVSFFLSSFLSSLALSFNLIIFLLHGVPQAKIRVQRPSWPARRVIFERASEASREAGKQVSNRRVKQKIGQDVVGVH